MGKYMKRPDARPYKIHPVWRGIGCVMIILVPIMAWVAAEELVKFGWAQGWSIMGELSGRLTLPGIFYSLPVISSLANALSRIANFPAQMLFFVLLLIAFSGILSFIYAVIYRVIGPPRYTQIDAPPPPDRPKRRIR